MFGFAVRLVVARSAAQGKGAVLAEEKGRIVVYMGEDQNSRPGNAECRQKPRSVEIALQFVLVEVEQRNKAHGECQKEV